MNSITFFISFIPSLALILLGVNLVFAPHNPYLEKSSTFECGFHSFLGQNRTQFNISFFVFALLFLVFDLELVMALPGLINIYTISVYGISIMLIFFVILAIGFAFELGRKALNIESKQTINIENKQTVNEIAGNFTVTYLIILIILYIWNNVMLNRTLYNNIALNNIMLNNITDIAISDNITDNIIMCESSGKNDKSSDKPGNKSGNNSGNNSDDSSDIESLPDLIPSDNFSAPNDPHVHVVPLFGDEWEITHSREKGCNCKANQDWVRKVNYMYFSLRGQNQWNIVQEESKPLFGDSWRFNSIKPKHQKHMTGFFDHNYSLIVVALKDNPCYDTSVPGKITITSDHPEYNDPLYQSDKNIRSTHHLAGTLRNHVRKEFKVLLHKEDPVRITPKVNWDQIWKDAQTGNDGIEFGKKNRIGRARWLAYRAESKWGLDDWPSTKPGVGPSTALNVEPKVGPSPGPSPEASPEPGVDPGIGPSDLI